MRKSISTYPVTLNAIDCVPVSNRKQKPILFFSAHPRRWVKSSSSAATKKERVAFFVCFFRHASLLKRSNSNRIDAKETAVEVAETEKEETVAGTYLCLSTDVSRNLRPWERAAVRTQWHWTRLIAYPDQTESRNQSFFFSTSLSMSEKQQQRSHPKTKNIIFCLFLSACIPSQPQQQQ